ncbi:cryptochrome/photolyase family protein [Endozoicomonas lisbonensis]|uniref:Deoxyribodipyrimidine photolyase-related protein n=1 Tax=Endozoicomonas lisbonensis TaxID=3120522 RepID=A0ABV2SJ12_9GAMM
MKNKLSGRTFETVRLILGDQLNSGHSWYDEINDQTLYVIAELISEQTYVKHHIQKQVAFFAAMDAFAQALQEEGHQVLHLTLDDTHRFRELSHLIREVCGLVECKHFQYQRPDEYRLLSILRQLKLEGCHTSEADTQHFLCDFETLPKEFESEKTVRLEHFYRRMRKRHNILLTQEQKPEGGKWNFDVENRKKLKKADIADIPEPLVFCTSTREYKDRLEKYSVAGFGQISEKLVWPINRQQALNLLAHFIHTCLCHFGTYQDAMTDQSEHAWSLYHSRLSFALNSKILSPLEVIRAAVDAYDSNPSHELLAQVEGFVRQILGWREYVRGMYWANMPGYETKNHLNHKRSLPSYFWSGDTKMNCIKQAVSQSLDTAYAHHIQRLMVTGNFSLLAEIEPKQVHEWYLGIYIDAIEWVEIPNTLGMALYADGGLIASKPYVSSGAYINRMSDYCASCEYNVKVRSEKGACPFNALYWRFMEKHREWLTRNPRMNMVYRNWDKLEDRERQRTLELAERQLIALEQL